MRQKSRFLIMAVLLVGSRRVDASEMVYRAVSTTTPTTTSTTTPRLTTMIMPQPTTSTSTAAATHTIAVGATGFNFSPDNITASVGDIIEFNFYPGNHSVARSAFKFPCIPYEDTGINRIGFFSSFQDTNVYSPDGPKYRIRVNDTEPIFYYCAAPDSCIGNHMIGAINPNTTWTLEIQEEYVANTTVQVTPGETLPSETTGTPASTKQGLSGGTIAGIVIGVLAALAVASAGFFYCHGSRYNPRWGGERLPSNRDLDGDGSNAHSAMLSPISPSGSPGRGITPMAYRRHEPTYPSSPAPGASGGPEMIDMAAYFASLSNLNSNNSGVVPLQSPYGTSGVASGRSHYSTAVVPHPHPHAGVPMYPGVMPGHAISPLHGHPPYPAAAGPVSGKDAPYYIHTSPVPFQLPFAPPRPPPVELPTAGSGSPPHLSGRDVPASPTQPIKESPTIGEPLGHGEES